MGYKNQHVAAECMEYFSEETHQKHKKKTNTSSKIMNYSKILALLLSLLLLHVQTVPVKSEADNKRSENQILKSTGDVLHIMLDLEQNYLTDSEENCTDYVNIRDTSTHGALCYMYDQYVTYRNHALSLKERDSNSTALQYIARNRLDSLCQWSQGNDSYSTPQEFIALKSLNITCQWARQKHINSLSNCSLCEIQQTCVQYRFCEHNNDLRSSIEDLVRKIPLDVSELLELDSSMETPSFEQVCKVIVSSASRNVTCSARSITSSCQ